LDALLHEQTDLTITVSDDPLTCVAHGAGKLLDEIDLLKRVAIAA
jgi:rod shape-determining protein MreB